MIPILIEKDKFQISEYHRAKLRQSVTDNDGKPVRGEINIITPESRNQRKYLMGGLLPLLVFLDGNDYKDGTVLEYYFEHYKREFSPELLKINGKIQTFGKSTKGSKALRNFIDKLQDYLHDEYGVSYDNKAISPDSYKEWRDTISISTTDDYIQYCISMKWIQ